MEPTTRAKGLTRKCATCGHLEASHVPTCKNGCGCWYAPPSECPLGIKAHNDPRGHTCGCVPGQLTLT